MNVFIWLIILYHLNYSSSQRPSNYVVIYDSTSQPIMSFLQQWNLNSSSIVLAQYDLLLNENLITTLNSSHFFLTASCSNIFQFSSLLDYLKIQINTTVISTQWCDTIFYKQLKNVNTVFQTDLRQIIPFLVQLTTYFESNMTLILTDIQDGILSTLGNSDAKHLIFSLQQCNNCTAFVNFMTENNYKSINIFILIYDNNCLNSFLEKIRTYNYFAEYHKWIIVILSNWNFQLILPPESSQTYIYSVPVGIVSFFPLTLLKSLNSASNKVQSVMMTNLIENVTDSRLQMHVLSSTFGGRLSLSTTASFQNNTIVSSTTETSIYPAAGTSNLNGLKLRVVVVQWTPSVFGGQPINVNNKTLLNNTRGYTIDILNILAERMNFTYEVFASPDGQYGSLKPDGTWSGLIGGVMRKEYDMAFSDITITEFRSKVVDFSATYMETNKVILMKTPELASKTLFFLMPFHPMMWLAICLALVITGFFMYLFSTFSPFSYWNLEDPDRVVDEINVKENVWSALGSLLQQGQDFYPGNISSKIVLGSWWLFVVVIFAAYSANLTGYLSINIYNVQIKSLEDLASQTKVKASILNGTNAYDLFRLADPQSVFGRVWQIKSMEYFANNDATAEAVKQRSDLAFITDLWKAVQYVATDCANLQMLNDAFYFAGYGIAVSKQSFLLEPLNAEIRNLIESGIIGKIVNKWMSSNKICLSNGGSTGAIDIESSLGVFILVGGFFASGVVYLLLEFFVVRFVINWKKGSVKIT